MPDSSDTAGVSGVAYASICTTVGNSSIAWKSPQNGNMPYVTMPATGGANLAVRTRLAMMKPSDRMLQVLSKRAKVNDKAGMSSPAG